jgi:hypothetical protein
MNRKTQCDAILQLLTDAGGEWVPLWKILELRISQYNARIHSLRHDLGFRIDNKRERDSEGQVHSWYRLVRNPDMPQDNGTFPVCDTPDGPRG